MTNSPEIKTFIRENSSLFWWIKDEDKENIETPFLVETILTYGDEKEVKRLFELVGIDAAARIFYQQTAQQRKSYRPKTINFFNLYFKKHAPRNIEHTTT